MFDLYSYECKVSVIYAIFEATDVSQAHSKMYTRVWKKVAKFLGVDEILIHSSLSRELQIFSMIQNLLENNKDFFRNVEFFLKYWLDEMDFC